MLNGFDNDLYTELQYNAIMERVIKYNNKLYLEFGGKLFDDFHAARVLPGFDPNIKTKLLLKFKDKAEIIFAISASDLEKNKIRADIGINYGLDVIRIVEKFRTLGLNVNSIVITQYSGQKAADVYRSKLEMLGERIYIHTKTAGYPTDVETIVSELGYGTNPYIETTKPLVIVTAPGPGSGKLATCLSQLYHESKKGNVAGYAKFETFPVWNLPLKHPVNRAYEAATADLKDVNMIDFFHLEAYGKPTVNYNRDIEVFPIVKNILERIQGTCEYKSPTDMGVNKVASAIINEEIVLKAAKQEILRRYYHLLKDKKFGFIGDEVIAKIEFLLSEYNITSANRPCVGAALIKADITKKPSFAIELDSGKIITGKQTEIMSAPASCILNAAKELCGIKDEINLISRSVLEPINALKTNIMKEDIACLNLHEVLIALSISAITNHMAEIAMSSIKKLSGAEAHSSCILHEADASVLRKLNINVTCEPKFESNVAFIE